MIPKWLQRLRGARGFGIHSPFGYRFVTEVLNLRLPYYAYAHTDTLATGRLKKADLRLLVRLGAYFDTCHLAVYGASAAETKALGDTLKYASGKADGPLIAVHFCRDSEFSEPQDGAICRMVFGKPRQLSAMTFSSRRGSIGVYLPYLPHQQFHVRF